MRRNGYTTLPQSATASQQHCSSSSSSSSSVSRHERRLLYSIAGAMATSGALFALAQMLPFSAWELLPWALYPPTILAYWRAIIIVGLFTVAWNVTRTDNVASPSDAIVAPLGAASSAAAAAASGWRSGAIACLAWQCGAALDLFDGPLARTTLTTSDLGALLDHRLLDPFGSLTVLAAACAALPEWDIAWALMLLRSIPPLSRLQLLHGGFAFEGVEFSNRFLSNCVHLLF